MDKKEPDLYIVSEDGMNCWTSGQYVIDKNKALIVVSHCCCEKSGLKQKTTYIKKYLNVDIEYIDDGMNATFIVVK